MNYFHLIQIKDKKRELIKERKNRKSLLNNLNLKEFKKGDVLIVNFWSQTYRYHFEGICLSVKKKQIVNPNVSVTLCNVLFGTGIEVTLSFFLNRLYKNIYIDDHKRKKFFYKASKLFFLKTRKNIATKVK